jgi:hypothetical protein
MNLDPISEKGMGFFIPFRWEGFERKGKQR